MFTTTRIASRSSTNYLIGNSCTYVSICTNTYHCVYVNKFAYIYTHTHTHTQRLPSSSVVKNPPSVQELQEMRVRSLGWEDPLEEGMATHSSILAWRIPCTEERGGLRSIRSQRVGHD